MQNIRAIHFRNFFLALIIIGITGRWIIIPAIKSEKVRRELSDKTNISVSKFQCLDKGTCGLSELSSMPFLVGENREKTRQQVLKVEYESHSNPRTYHFLRGSLVKGIDDEDSVSFVNSLDKENKIYYLQGLFFCQHVECQEFIENHLSKLNLNELDEFRLKFLLRKSGSWRIKNDYLKELLDMYSRNGEFSKALHLIDHIPNHPRLKRFIEAHYEDVVSDFLIMKASVYLSRYNKGWHVRKLDKLIEKGSLIHIDNFLSTLKNDCPSDMKKIDKFFESLLKKNKLNDHSRELYKESLRYIVTNKDELFKKYNLREQDLVKGSLCHRSSF